MQGDLGFIGLAVMGQNLVLNMADHGYSVVVYNRTEEKTRHFIQGPGANPGIQAAASLQDLVQKLKRPRRIMLMVKAGAPVDALLEKLLPLLQEGDIVIDGGNSHWPDTRRRTRNLHQRGIFFIGMGVSGGEEGARRGPSLMPGGNALGWKPVKDLFQSIAAQAEGDPCCQWVGADGAGHFVKMVHNGIEYGDLQLISEAYWLMKQGLGLSCAEMAEVFSTWNRGELDSYLIEITARILDFQDADGQPLVEKIIDSAGQKGTGKWTVFSALEEGNPLTLIGEAVMARFLSALKEQRQRAEHLLKGPRLALPWARQEGIEMIRQALLASKIVSYAQGFSLIRQASLAYNWNINFASVASLWRGGCIIRSVFLKDIRQAFELAPEEENLMLAPAFTQRLAKCQNGWRETISQAALKGWPAPAMAAALSYYDGFRSGVLPAQLIQAQRDFFGAHTYRRTDQPEEIFHTDWTGSGGDVSSGTYNA